MPGQLKAALHKAHYAPSYASLDALAAQLERVLKQLGVPTGKAIANLIGTGQSLPEGTIELIEVLITQLESSPDAAACFMLVSEALWC